MSEFFVGPREWSPRIKRMLRHLESIKNAVPEQLLVLEQSIICTEGRSFLTDQTYKTQDGTQWMLVLAVQAGATSQDIGVVFLSETGKLAVSKRIIALLRGEIPGCERLKDRWPWGDELGPVEELTVS